MKRPDVIALIVEIAGLEDAFDILEREFAQITKDELSSRTFIGNVVLCRVRYWNTTRSEEKLWAKYCDILLAQTWTHLSIPAEVLR